MRLLSTTHPYELLLTTWVVFTHSTRIMRAFLLTSLSLAFTCIHIKLDMVEHTTTCIHSTQLKVSNRPNKRRTSGAYIDESKCLGCVDYLLTK